MKIVKTIILLIFTSGFGGTLLFSQDIHQAAKEGNFYLVDSILKQDPEVLYLKSSGGSCPLHFAAISNNAKLVEFLIEKGAEVDAQNYRGYTPLHYASAYNLPETMAVLLRHNARLEISSLEDETALHLASSSGALAATRVLLEVGANISAREARQRTPLLLAARESGKVDVASLLIAFNADIDAVDRSGSCALELAAWRGYADLVSLLLDEGALIPQDEEIRLKLLGYSLNKRLEPLLFALIKAGVDLGSYSRNHPDLILEAAAGGSAKILNILIQHGFRLDYKDPCGWTAIHNAAEYDRLEVLGLLLDHGMDIESRTVLGQTAFNIASEEGSTAAAGLLESRGCESVSPRFPEIMGCYLGEEEPGDNPKIFAPGIVNAHFKLHTSVSFSPDGQSAVWSVMIPPRESGYGSGRMMVTHLENGRWGYPRQPVFPGGDVPFFSPDGKRLYYISRKPAYEGGPEKENIWYVERSGSGWSVPHPLDRVVNDVPMHWQFSIDKQHTIYFGSGDGRIMVAQYQGDKYLAPVDFRELFNHEEVAGGSPFISKDGDYLIFTKEDDLYITFRSSGNLWSPIQKFDDPINSSGYDNCPIVSPDGEFLFYLQGWEIKWVAIREKLNEMRNLSFRHD